MAINYSQIFGVIGKYIDAINEMSSDRETINGTTLTDAIHDKLETGGWQHIYRVDAFSAAGAAITGRVLALRADLERVMTHPTFLRPDLPQLGNDVTMTGILRALIRQMIEDSEDVLRKPLASAVVAAVDNAANGSSNVGFAFGLAELSGTSGPGKYSPVMRDYRALDSELIEDDTINLVCTADSESNGVTEGGETWQVAGVTEKNVNSGNFDGNFGIGVGSTITTANANTLVVNHGFENWTANEPDNWDVDAGTGGTDFLEETGASNVFRGSSSLEANTSATWTISQDIAASSFVPGQGYYLSVKWKVASLLTAGSITVKVKDDSTTFLTLTLDSTNDGTTFQNVSGTFFMPYEIDGTNVNVEIDAATGPDQLAYIDEVVLVPLNYYNGIGFIVEAGPQIWLKDDRVSLNPTISSPTADSFNTYFTRYHWVQLPSDPSPSIADTLITA